MTSTGHPSDPIFHQIVRADPGNGFYSVTERFTITASSVVGVSNTTADIAFLADPASVPGPSQAQDFPAGFWRAVAFSGGGDGGSGRRSPEFAARFVCALKPALFQIENDDDRDERDHDCEREQNGLHVIANPSEKHGIRHQNTRARRSLMRQRR
jgi:hypothetical protein